MVDTGFGIVAKNILAALHEKGHEIFILGINFFGDPYDTEKYPYHIWPVDKGSIENLYAYPKLWWIEEQVRPDIIFFLNDPWVVNKYLSFRPQTERAEYQKLIIYYPTDAGPMKKEWVEMLDKMDAQICYSNFAERVLIASNNNVRPDNLYQIYHGVDTKVFHPVQQSVARSNLNIPQDVFIVGMVARNQYRKRFDILVKAFAKFAKDKKNVKLYLHTALQDVGYDIADLIYQYKLEDKLILTEDITPSKGVPEEVLNLIYNTFDINCLISLGDGFGLPVAESMATGCVQLVSGHSCLEELVEGHGGLTVKTSAWLLNTGGINTWGGVSDEDDLVAKLEILYNNKEIRMQYAQQGYDFITQPKFTWEFIGEQFNRIIGEIFHVIVPQNTFQEPKVLEGVN
jgi:glycosyltransferase involved in cell wall biosynthesis